MKKIGSLNIGESGDSRFVYAIMDCLFTRNQIETEDFSDEKEQFLKSKRTINFVIIFYVRKYVLIKLLFLFSAL